jgi:hypothetical protein
MRRNTRKPTRVFGVIPVKKGRMDLHERPHIDRGRLAAMSAAIALACVVVLTLQIHDRWQSPEIKSPDQAARETTGQVAQERGARILPTNPPLSVEPAPDGPKQAQPASPG